MEIKMNENEEIVKEELVNKRQIDENTDIEIIKTSNNYDPSSFNQGSNLKMMKPYTRVRKPFNKYGSFTFLVLFSKYGFLLFIPILSFGKPTIPFSNSILKLLLL